MLTNTPLTQSLLLSRLLAGRAFLVKTPVCIAYYAILQRWLLTGTQGAVVFGRPRLGKTSGTRWVLRAIQQIFGKIAFIEIPVRKQHMAHEGGFFQFICKCGHHRHYKDGSVADRRDRCTEMLVERARRSPTRMVILFFDEAQQLSQLQYEWLVNISNEMEQAGYRVFFLLVGQSELAKKREELTDKGMEQIVGRFMTEKWSFTGLASKSDLEAVLEGYDMATYPPGDIQAKSFISYFVPEAYQANWRLKCLADKLWSAYEEAWKTCTAKGSLILPMHYVNSVVASLLNTASQQDSALLAVSEKEIMKAVKSSGFIAATAALSVISKGYGK